MPPEMPPTEAPLGRGGRTITRHELLLTAWREIIASPSLVNELRHEARAAAGSR